MERYFITAPVQGGEQWWNVCDRQDLAQPNAVVASFAAHLKDAGGMAWMTCSQLNAKIEPTS